MAIERLTGWALSETEAEATSGSGFLASASVPAAGFGSSAAKAKPGACRAARDRPMVRAASVRRMAVSPEGLIGGPSRRGALGEGHAPVHRVRPSGVRPLRRAVDSTAPTTGRPLPDKELCPSIKKRTEGRKAAQRLPDGDRISRLRP